MAAKLNSSKASAKLITVTAIYLSKAQYSRKMLTLLQEFTAFGALTPNLFQVWLIYQNPYRLSGLTGVCISLKQISSSKKCIILSLVWAESQYSFGLYSSHSIWECLPIWSPLSIFYFTTIRACAEYPCVSL